MQSAHRSVDGNQWHLDKKVPIAIITAFVIQTATLLTIGSYWVSQTDSRLKHLEEVDRQVAVSRASNIERLNRLDGIVQVLVSQGTEVVRRLDRIEDKIDRAIGGDVGAEP